MSNDSDGRHAAQAFVLSVLADPDFVYTLVQYWLSSFETTVAPERQFAAFFVRLTATPINLEAYTAMLIPSDHGAIRAVPVNYVSFCGREDYAFSDEFLEKTGNARALAALSLLLHPTHRAFQEIDTTSVLGKCHRRHFLYSATLQHYARLDVVLMATYAQILRILGTLDVEMAVVTRLLSSLVSQLELRALNDPTQILAYGPAEDDEHPTIRAHRRACARVCATIRHETHTLIQACGQQAYAKEMALECADRLWTPYCEQARNDLTAQYTRLAQMIQKECI